MKKTADSCRIIITQKCNLNCEYCCNRIPEMIETFEPCNLNAIIKLDYDSINITGGEPFMEFDRLYQIIDEISHTRAKIYLYTNGYDNFRRLFLSQYLSGINIGVHEENYPDAVIIAKEWKEYNIANVRLHVQDTKITDSLKTFCEENEILLKPWTLNECEPKVKEDRYII